MTDDFLYCSALWPVLGAYLLRYSWGNGVSLRGAARLHPDAEGKKFTASLFFWVTSRNKTFFTFMFDCTSTVFFIRWNGASETLLRIRTGIQGILINRKSGVTSWTLWVIYGNIFLFLFGATAPSRPAPPHSRGFLMTLNDASQSVGLIWTSD